MTQLKKLIIFLSQFDFASLKIEKIISFLGEDATLKGFKKAKFPENILNAEQKEKMLTSAEETLIDTYVINLADRGIKITTKFDQDFPQKLIHLDECPFILYYVGDLSLVDRPSISIVGTRKPTSYGYMVTEKLTRAVAEAGIVVVSGLAYGIDSIAHRKCLEVGGKTIAVLGGGFDHIYPAEHMGLAKEIAEKGLLLSEFRPKQSVTKYNFPLRNRIIAGLGDGTLITEASFKSGTIHTKDFALEYGRNVYAVPGNIDSPLSALPNDIVKSGQGRCVLHVDDILLDYADCRVKKGQIQTRMFVDFDETELSDDEKIVLKCLKNGMLSLDELTKSANIPAKNLNSCLTTLEISGLINRVPGGMIALN